MTNTITLSMLTQAIQQTLDERFVGQTFWISAEISDVKKQALARRCYLKFIEKLDNATLAELRAVFWSTAYEQIENFEKLTKQSFVNGLKVICLVKIRYHQVYGLNADVLQIDMAHSLGTLEMERQQTFERLLKTHPSKIQLQGEKYITFSNSLPLPIVVQRIALITAPNSDGQRDFVKELQENKYGFAFKVDEFLCTIQGDNAHLAILEQLNLVKEKASNYDVVAIVRGGGSQTDFAPFANYELAEAVALFPIPVFTGIGHDRNSSIVDAMAREYKTPTKVAAQLVEYNFEFENLLLQYKQRFDEQVKYKLQKAKQDLQESKRLVKLGSPETIMNKGFAIIEKEGELIVDANKLLAGDTIHIRMRKQIIKSKILKPNE